MGTSTEWSVSLSEWYPQDTFIQTPTGCLPPAVTQGRLPVHSPLCPTGPYLRQMSLYTRWGLPSWEWDLSLVTRPAGADNGGRVDF